MKQQNGKEGNQAFFNREHGKVQFSDLVILNFQINIGQIIEKGKLT